MGVWNLQKINAGGQTSGPPLQIPMSGPCVSVYNGQQHVGYFDSAGNLWDSWYDGSKWNLQKINAGGCTSSPPGWAGGTPFIWVINNQQHFTYVDTNAKIWDSWYDGSGGWHTQQINAGGMTNGPLAMGLPSASVYTGGQEHIGYFDESGNVWDSWYNGNNSWSLQKINGGGCTTGPAAAAGTYSPGPFIWVVSGQQHFTYPDAHGTIWDSWYGGNAWHLQQINAGGLTKGPAAVGFPFASVYNGQQHIFYRDSTGTIWDSWYNGSNWNLQQINAGGCTTGPATVNDPTASVYLGQQHVAYRDAGGNIWDSFYDGSKWNLQKINAGGCTTGPAALKSPYIWVYNSQQHYTYSDISGTIWDSWYDASPALVVTSSSIVYNHAIGLSGPDTGSIQGPLNLTLTSDGSYNFSGNVQNTNLFTYNFAVLVAIASKSGTVFTFAVPAGGGAQSIPGVLESGSSNYAWDNHGMNGTIKAIWSDLQAGCTANYQASASLDLGALWNEIKGAIGAVKDVVAVVGPLFA